MIMSVIMIMSVQGKPLVPPPARVLLAERLKH